MRGFRTSSSDQPPAGRVNAGPILLGLVLAVLATLAGRSALVQRARSEAAKSGATGSAARANLGALPGMPPLLDAKDIYAADRPGNLSADGPGLSLRACMCPTARVTR